LMLAVASAIREPLRRARSFKELILSAPRMCEQ
jgi:hypothetical protein